MSIPDTMMAVVARGIGDYRLERLPVPRPGAGELLVKVEACGLCAGDIKATHGTARFWGGDGMPGYCEPPFTPGHEFLGRVVARGEGAPEEFPVGARVASEQIVPCGKCLYCKTGRYWLCDPHNVYGFKYYLNGGMAEYVILPAGSRNYPVPEALPTEQAVLIEPYACSLHAVRRAEITVDDAVVLAGCGTLGLGMAGAIRRRNPRLFIALDTREDRLALARSFGADVTINPMDDDAAARVLELTGGYGCDVYIEATGNPAAVNQGLAVIKKGGTFIEFSVFSGPTTADWSIIGDTKEITIKGSQLSPYCFPASIEGIASGELPTKGVVTHQFPLEKFAKAFETAQGPGAIKVILRMD